MVELQLYLAVMREWGNIAGVDGILEHVADRTLSGDVASARRILEELVALRWAAWIGEPTGLLAITCRIA